MPYVVRHLGPDRFGLLSVAWIVVGYFALFDLGIGPATTKFVAELLGKGEIEKLPAVVWTALVTQTGFGLLAGILLAAASPVFVNRLLKIPAGLRPDAHWVFLILAVSFPINFAGGSLRGVLSASQRFDLLNAIGIPSSALGYLIPALALALGFDLPAIVLFLVISRVVGLGASFFSVFASIQPWVAGARSTARWFAACSASAAGLPSPTRFSRSCYTSIGFSSAPSNPSPQSAFIRLLL